MPSSATAISTDLLAACRRGEERAQQQLYQQLAYSLMGVCLRYCPSREEAEDALQNTFIKLFTRLHQFRGEGPFEAWARRIAVHTCLHALAQYRLRQTHGTVAAGLEEAHEEVPGAEPLAFDQLAAADLLRCLAELPPGYRTILNLYAIEGYSHPEIAELLGISEGTSKSQLLRGRRLLAQRLRLTNCPTCQL